MLNTESSRSTHHRLTAVPSALLKLLFILTCALPLWAGVATAKNAGAVKPAIAAKYANGVLWKIDKPGIKPSYLFGTIHSDDPRVTSLPEPVIQALDASHRFILEAVIDEESILTMAEAMYFNDSRTLKQVIGTKLYTESINALKARGIPAVAIEKQKPWAVIMALSVPPFKTGEFLDLVLESRATQQNKPVSGLETIEEQIAVLDDLPMPEQIALLKEAVRMQNDFAIALEEMIKAYLARNLVSLVEITEKYEPTDDALARRFNDRLLTQRNTRMAQRMAPMLKQGSVFVAVGAGHLPGEAGLLYLIEKAGYRVTSVY